MKINNLPPFVCLFIMTCLLVCSGCSSLSAIKTSMATDGAMEKGDAAQALGNFETAAQQYLFAAKPDGYSIRQGNPEAQYWLALFYNYGKGVKKDKTHAVYWMKASADNGYPPGQLSYGLWNLRGYGIEKDTESGIRYIRASADQGNPDALFLLASLTNQGSLVKQDKNKAREHFIRARDEGFPVPPEFLSSGQIAEEPEKQHSYTSQPEMDRRQRIREIQRALTTLGFNPGPVDGLMGICL